MPSPLFVPAIDKVWQRCAAQEEAWPAWLLAAERRAEEEAKDAVFLDSFWVDDEEEASLAAERRAAQEEASLAAERRAEEEASLAAERRAEESSPSFGQCELLIEDDEAMDERPAQDNAEDEHFSQDELLTEDEPSTPEGHQEGRREEGRRAGLNEATSSRRPPHRGEKGEKKDGELASTPEGQMSPDEPGLSLAGIVPSGIVPPGTFCWIFDDDHLRELLVIDAHLMPVKFVQFAKKACKTCLP